MLPKVLWLTAVSLVFVASFVGGLIAGLANVFITDKIGFAYVSIAFSVRAKSRRLPSAR